MASKKLLNKVTSVIESIETIAKYIHIYSSDRDDISKLKVRYDNLNSLWETYLEVQSEIESIDMSYIKKRAPVEELYYDTKATYQTLLLKDDTTQCDAIRVKPEPSLKLPKISLPEFNGDYQEWKSFRHMFETVIHTNKEVPNVQKFYYLRKALSEEPLQVISSIAVTDLNYTIAWQLLCERYDNDQFIINSHMQSLFEQKIMQKNSVTCLRRLTSDTKQHLRSLGNLGLPIESWDMMIIFMLKQKLDIDTRRQWEFHKKESNLPTLKSFYTFLEQRCNALEMVNASATHQPIQQDRKQQQRVKACVTVQERKNCPVCRENFHYLYQCIAFKKLNTKDRINAVKAANLCFNCLNLNCSAYQCTRGACKHCGKKHNTLLHIFKDVTANNLHNVTGSTEGGGDTITTGPSNDTPNTSNVKQNVSLMSAARTSEVLIPTAIVLVADSKGHYHKVRALLDSASQSSFITTKLVQKLVLKVERSNIIVGGINQLSSSVNSSVKINIKSCVTSYEKAIECLMLDQITTSLPNNYVHYNNWNIPSNIILADPTFNQPAAVDLLLGAELFLELLQGGQLQIGKQLPILQNTTLGWIIVGKFHNSNAKQSFNFLCTSREDNNLQDQLNKFWSIEETPSKPIMTQEERSCEDIFDQTTTRDNEGRFIVNLPLRESEKNLGESYKLAHQRLIYLKRKLNNNPQLNVEYSKFLDEYQKLGHMEAVTDNGDNVNYYVPHHAVVKETSTTTRVRVVFDASMKTSNGKSLNDILQVGPVVQQDLISIVLRFRTHRYAFTTDIVKMYRQIWINPNQWSLQQILWEDDQARLKVFKLKTVTYGTASAPYLATKCLQRLAQDEEEEFPIASKILKRDFYVDDCLTGSSELHEAIYLQQQLSKLLHKGGFELRKWSSNSPELLNNIAVEDREAIKAIPSKDYIIRTLGLLWQPAKDILLICIETSAQQATTKREVLACIARIFDPIGLLGPVTLRAKTFMQQLWKSKCEWDDPLPIEIQTKWNKFQDQLSHLKSISVKRFVLSEAPYQSLEMHGFADASEQAYGAALYVRCVTTNNEVSVNLLCSKTRLAPLKQISLPRLELCAALLLARLIKNSLASLEVKYTQVYLWTDSMIVLNWIAATPTRWKTFVANRVAEIQEITQSHTWRHIASNDNPADLASRGLNPSELETASLWWMGPQWLHDTKDEWPITKMQIVNNIPEVKSDKVITHVTIQEVPFLNKYSSWGKMKRIVAVMLRFIKNSQSVANKRISGPITLSEIRIAERSILKSIQGIEFKQEIMTIRDRKPLNVKSKLLNLNPFLDQYGLLRVGGRLKYAEITSDRRHPIVLPAKAKVTKLIAFEYHITNLHVGPQGLLCMLREQYWPLAGRSIVRQVVHQCITCFRNKPKSHPPIMGQLPSSRVVPARPFSKVGIDYAGPIPIKQSGSRKSPIIKAYIAVFDCMVTKAIHLELVTSLSSEGFVAALKRFMGRRGKCQEIYCDNGTNFVGAKKQLNDLHQLVLKQTAQEDIKRDIHPDMISWHFIPPHAPHFGGLWEASVKAVKFHLKRVVGNTNLTFEELYTLLVQIEACLNSRPITPMSEDPSDLSALTPAHFLIGDSLQLPIEPVQRSTHTNYLKRWQLI